MDDKTKPEGEKEDSASLQSQIDELLERGSVAQAGKKSLRDFIAEKMAEDKEQKEKG